MADNHVLTFPVAFPPNCQPLRGGNGEATRMWLDCYVDDMTVAKLFAVGRIKPRMLCHLEILPDEQKPPTRGDEQAPTEGPIDANA